MSPKIAVKKSSPKEWITNVHFLCLKTLKNGLIPKITAENHDY